MRIRVFLVRVADALLASGASGVKLNARSGEAFREALRAVRSDVSLFYPSSVYVEERPRGMIEYAMAKAAGETLCTEMNLAWAPLRVAVGRLPRLPTDQTASVIETKFPSPVACLLTFVRETQSLPRRARKEIPQ